MCWKPYALDPTLVRITFAVDVEAVRPAVSSVHIHGSRSINAVTHINSNTQPCITVLDNVVHGGATLAGGALEGPGSPNPRHPPRPR